MQRLMKLENKFNRLKLHKQVRIALEVMAESDPVLKTITRISHAVILIFPLILAVHGLLIPLIIYICALTILAFWMHWAK